MIRLVLLFSICFGVSTALAESKSASCGYQADVVAAVQQARLDRVGERDVARHIAANAPTWPDNYNNSIPLIAAWVYEQRRRDIRNQDLSAIWQEMCLQMPDSATN